MQHCLTVWLLALVLSACARATSVPANIDKVDLMALGQLYAAPVGTEATPWPRVGEPEALAAWFKTLSRVKAVSFFGGSYVLDTTFRHDSANTLWVIAPSGTLIQRIHLRVIDATTGEVFESHSGYEASAEFLLHYGRSVRLGAGKTYRILIYFESPYFASRPVFELEPEAQYQHGVALANALALCAFGALLTLAIYNAFLATGTRDRATIWYAAYLLAYAIAWAFTFHVFAHVFNLRALHWHYVGFFALPVLNTIFYRDFLKLKTHAPQLYRLSHINIALPLILLPSCWLALPYAHTLATIVITIWLTLGLISGIVCWRQGYRPARYFVLAFIAILIPGLVILPANLNLVPRLVQNAELFTLLGGTLDALLLAFALADRIRVLENEKARYLAHLNLALDQARTDSLTGIGNRHAFELAITEIFAANNATTKYMLILIDLDGLKRVNDEMGHAKGDELLQNFAGELKQLATQTIKVYRLGGDEFAVLAPPEQETMLREHLSAIETRIQHQGFTQSGVSYGVSLDITLATRDDALSTADARMYEHKNERKRARGYISAPNGS